LIGRKKSKTVHFVTLSGWQVQGYCCEDSAGPTRDLTAYFTDDSRLSTVILDRLLRAELFKGCRARM
jgi:hypothetical protein